MHLRWHQADPAVPGDPADIHFADATLEIIAIWQQQRDRLSDRVSLLARARHHDDPYRLAAWMDAGCAAGAARP
jgi:hypothetical protein